MAYWQYFVIAMLPSLIYVAANLVRPRDYTR